MSSTIEKLVNLLSEKIWIFPKKEEKRLIQRKLNKIINSSTNLLEKIYLGTVKNNRNFRRIREQLLEFSLNLLGEELTNTLTHIETKEKEFLDPISLEIMRNPQNLHATGQIYDKKPLEKHLSIKRTCPLTGQELKDARYSPCVSLKNNIDKYIFNLKENVSKLGSLSVLLLNQLKVSVINVFGFPLGLNFEESKLFEGHLTKIVRIVKYVGKYDPEYLPILKLKESLYIIQNKKKELLYIRMKIAQIYISFNQYVEANNILVKGIKNTGLIGKKQRDYYHVMEEILTCIFYNNKQIRNNEKNLISSMFDLTWFYFSNGKTVRAEKLVSEFKEIYPNNLRILRHYARIQSPEAGSKTYFEICRILVRSKADQETVLEAFNKALELNPKNVKCREFFVEYLEKNKVRNKKSIDYKLVASGTKDTITQTKYLKQAIQENPKDTSAVEELSKIYLEKGEYEKLLSIGDGEKTGKVDKNPNQNSLIVNSILVKQLKKQQKEIEDLKKFVVKMHKDNNQKMKILFTQYKDIRQHFVENKSDTEQIKAFILLQSKARVVIQRPQLGQTVVSKEFQLCGMTFFAKIRSSLNGKVSISLNLKEADLRGSCLVLVKFKDKEDQMRFSFEKGVLDLRDKFHYYVDSEWVLDIYIKNVTFSIS